MLLSALLLAAAIFQPAPVAHSSGAVAPRIRKPACVAPPLDYTADRTQAQASKLGDLPPANHTLTVLRSVDGCPVSSTVRYGVDRPASLTDFSNRH